MQTIGAPYQAQIRLQVSYRVYYMVWHHREYARTWQIVSAEDIWSALLVSVLFCFLPLVSSAGQCFSLFLV